MLLPEGSSQAALFINSSDYVFGVRHFGNTKSLSVIFSPKYLKFNIDFKSLAENWEKVFCCWHNWMWIGIVKLSLIRTGYFSLAANVLTSTTKILHVNKRDFVQHNFPGSDQLIWWRCCDEDLKTSWKHLPCCFSKGPLNWDFLDVYLTTFSESVISKIQNLWGSSFFSNCLNFYLDLKNAAKNWERVLRFWDNMIWIGTVKISLLRTFHQQLMC